MLPSVPDTLGYQNDVMKPQAMGASLRQARLRLFVGRAQERATFNHAINADTLPFSVLFIFGPGGVGKTLLLQAFVHDCAQAGVAFSTLDARDFDTRSAPMLARAILHATSDAALTGVTTSMTTGAAQAVLTGDRRVILLDAYDEFATPDGDRWLREHVLTQLPSNTLIVLASRRPPSPTWLADPGWQQLVRWMPMRNLDPDESRTYLDLRRMPSAQQQHALAFTHGHPLALSLIADLFAQGSQVRFDPSQSPDLIQHLLARLLDHVPDPTHRTALEASALLRTINEEALSQILGLSVGSVGSVGSANCRDLFDWLHDLSFVESNRDGVSPHDLAREAIVADLRWRAPDRFSDLRSRAGRYVFRRLQTATGDHQQKSMLELAYLYRHSKIFSSFMPLTTDSADVVTEPAKPEDFSALAQMVEHYEGSQSAQVAQHWFERQPQGVTVVREVMRSPQAALPTDIAAFCCVVMLDEASEEDRAADPHARAIWQYLRGHAPLADGEKAMLGRFWMGRDTHQQISPTSSLCFAILARHFLTIPNLAFTSNHHHDAESWEPILAFTDFPLLPEASFEIDGRICKPNHHDWRITPPQAWLELLMAQLEGSDGGSLEPLPSQPQLAALSKPEFDRAVRQALRDLSQFDALGRNPLVYASFVNDASGEHDDERQRAQALQRRLLEAIETLQQSPRDLKLYRALQAAFVKPALTHKQAAQSLHVSLSTFRRDMRAGVARVASLLWLDER